VSSRSSAPPRSPSSPSELVDYAKSLDCIHCGLCLHTCPTYQLTGAEPSSPRGRIHLMRAVAEGRLAADEDFREEMEFCLVCRHCESVCPAGVQFGAMMEFTRDRLVARERRPPRERFLRWLGFGRVLGSRRWLSFVAGATRLAQRSGLLAGAARLLGERGDALAALPAFPPRAERRPLPQVTPAAPGPPRERVALLEGCVMPELFGRVNRATARTLAAVGAEVRCARGHACCGALHAHNGDLSGARALARATVEAFEPLDGPLVVNSAGCGAHMKEYGRLLAGDAAYAARAAALAARVVDYTEFLAAPERLALLRSRLGELGALRVTWDDPCHLCHGQGIRASGRALIDAIPGLLRVEMPHAESCCGSAGIYSLLRPADSRAVLEPKLDELDASGARLLVTANPGCQMQWASGVERRGSSVEVLHVAELLARSLDAGARAVPGARSPAGPQPPEAAPAAGAPRGA